VSGFRAPLGRGEDERRVTVEFLLRAARQRRRDAAYYGDLAQWEIAAEAERAATILGRAARQVARGHQHEEELPPVGAESGNRTRWVALWKTSESGRALYLCRTCGGESVTADKVCAAGCFENAVIGPGPHPSYPITGVRAGEA